MSWAGFFAPWAIYGLITLFHLLIPARRVAGYVTDPSTAQPFRYRLNGLFVYLLTMATWGALCGQGLLAWDFLWTTRWEGLAGACTFGLLFTGWVVFTTPPTDKPLLAQIFLGRAENPQWLGGRVDAKMWLYLVGATMLGLNLYSFAMHHRLRFPDDPSPGVLLYVGLFSFFLCEYLYFERVHLYTYDFFAERVGFKLGWGCLLFYPYFYGVGLWSVAELPNPQQSPLRLGLAALTFFAGWSLARGANLQKYRFKQDPQARFLGIAPEVVSDGQRSLLVSGFWRVSRHVNYLGEILMAVGLTGALGYPELASTWLYPIYYLALLIPRQRDDDRRCAQKYGPLWDRYREKVRFRIVPGIY